MSSKLAERKTRAAFETVDVVFSQGIRRQVVIELLPGFARMRLKGTRTSFDLPYSSAFLLAVKAADAAKRREKAEAKKAAKQGRAA
jgi:hypothetical protein